MASLYEIDQAIMACVDSETGEVVDPEALDALMMERDQKCENIALWIKNLEADAIAYKAEKDAFASRQKAAETKAEQLKAYLSAALAGNKFSTTKCAVSFRASEETVCNQAQVPKKWCIKKVEYKPDKNAIKAALKAGQKIRGCELISKLNVQIK